MAHVFHIFLRLSERRYSMSLSSLLRAKVLAPAIFYGDRNLGDPISALSGTYVRPSLLGSPLQAHDFNDPVATRRGLTDRHRKVSPIIILRWA